MPSKSRSWAIHKVLFRQIISTRKIRVKLYLKYKTFKKELHGVRSEKNNTIYFYFILKEQRVKKINVYGSLVFTYLTSLDLCVSTVLTFLSYFPHESKLFSLHINWTYPIWNSSVSHCTFKTSRSVRRIQVFFAVCTVVLSSGWWQAVCSPIFSWIQHKNTPNISWMITNTPLALKTSQRSFYHPKDPFRNTF